VQTTQIVVAARDLPIGTLIHEVDLKMAASLSPLPAGSSLKLSDVVNRGVVSSIYAGEPVTENRLSPKGSGGGLAAMIPPGMRACAVKVNDVVGVAGFVVPGMRVDVLITGVPPGGNAADGAKVRTLLENIQVLSAGTNFQRDREGKAEPAQVVNLLVTPAQAEILSLASNETHIQLVLRNPIDTGVSRPPGMILSDLFGKTRDPQEVPAPSASLRGRTPATHPAPPLIAIPAVRKVYTIQISNGSVHSQVEFTQPAGTQ